MKKILFLLLITSLLVTNVYAGSVPLAWEAPLKNEDGTPLTDLAGHRIYQGFENITGANYKNVKELPEPVVPGSTVRYTFTGLPEGDSYFRVKAYDTSGNIGGYSNEVKKNVVVAPGVGTNLR